MTEKGELPTHEPVAAVVGVLERELDFPNAGQVVDLDSAYRRFVRHLKRERRREVRIEVLVVGLNVPVPGAREQGRGVSDRKGRLGVG